MTHFDRYVAVDWSAAATPTTGPNSIWIAARGRGEPRGTLANPATRAEAVDALVTMLVKARARGERVVVGVDACFGYPRGTLAALGLGDWSELWALLAEEISDGDDNANNRFAVAAALNERLGGGPGPFWAGPASACGRSLAATRGPFPHALGGRRALAEYRRCEELLRARGDRVQSAWKLYTPGSVGGQTLTAIARLDALRRHPSLGGDVVIWPFEIDPSVLARRPLAVLAELWPAGLERGDHPVVDAGQVLAAVAHLADLDEAGNLTGLLTLADAAAADAATARQEEGWILGAGLSP